MRKTTLHRCPHIESQGGNSPTLWRPCLPLSAVTVSLHYLPRCLRSTVTCAKLDVNLMWTLEYLLPCYCYTIKTNSRTIRSQVGQPASACKGADIYYCSGMLWDEWLVSIVVRECIFLGMQNIFTQIWPCFSQITYERHIAMLRLKRTYHCKQIKVPACLIILVVTAQKHFTTGLHNIRSARAFSIVENSAKARSRISNCCSRISCILQRNLHIETK